MQSVISPVLLPTLRIPPPPTPPSSFNGPGSRCRFPGSVPHCVTEPVKWGPTLLQGHLGDDSRCAPLEKDRPTTSTQERGAGGGGKINKAPGRIPLQRPKVLACARHRRCQIHRIPKGDSAVIAEPGGGVAPAESGRSGPWPLGLPPERTSPSPRGSDTIQPPGPNLANRGTARSRAPRAAEGSGLWRPAPGTPIPAPAGSARARN